MIPNSDILSRSGKSRFAELGLGLVSRGLVLSRNTPIPPPLFLFYCQYHKSNSALDLMIGELRLKVDGMQKELNAQSTKLEEGRRFNEQFQKDLNEVVQVTGARSPAHDGRAHHFSDKIDRPRAFPLG